MSAQEWYGVIDSDGIVVGRWETAEEAERDVDELNGPLGPGIDAEYDYKRCED